MAEENNAANEETATAEAASGEDSPLRTATDKVRQQREDKVPHRIVEENPQPGSKRQLVIEIPREEWNRRVEELFKEIRQNAAIEGFRKGKAPMRLLQRRYMKDANADVASKIVPPIIQQYRDEKDATIYGDPVLTDFTVEEDKDVRVVTEIVVKPEIEPKDYTGLEVEAEGVNLDETIIDSRIEEMRNQNAIYEEVDRPLEREDAAVLDLQIVDSKGQTVKTETNTLFEALEGELPPEVVDELVGKKAGDTLEVKAKNPANPSDTLHFTITVKSVKESRVPDLDNEFAKDLGHESLQGLRQSVRNDIQLRIDKIQNDNAFDAIMEKIVASNDCEVPEPLKESAERSMLRADLEFLKYTGMEPARMRNRSHDAYYKEMERSAEARVKGYLLLDAIGRKEGIQATEEDINAALEERAQAEARKSAAIRAALERRRELDEFIDQVRLDKIRTFLLENSKVKFVEPRQPEPEPEFVESEENATGKAEETRPGA